MFNGGFRKKSSQVFDRIGSLFAWTHIPPNVFSSLALVVAGLGALFFFLRLYIPAWLFIGIACLWDTFDGGLARAEKRVTRFGYYLEGIIDKWVEIIIYAGFAFSGYPIESFLVISATLMVSFAKSRTSQVVPVGEHDWPGVGERLDRLILLNVGLVVFLFLSHVHVFGRTVRTLSVFFLVIFAMELVGGLQRVLYARRIIRAGGTGQMSVETRDVFSNEGK